VEAETSSDLLEFRFIFDSGCYKAAARKGTEEDHRQIEAQIQRMEEYIAHGDGEAEADPRVLAQLDLDFHVAVMQASHNPLIVKVGQLLNTMLLELIKRNMAAPGAGEWTVQRHRIILQNLIDREPLNIEPAMTEASAGLKKIVNQHYSSNSPSISQRT
jgi:DNA-binding FadR family transcriptional regulator